MFKFNCGDEVKDVCTGFQGIVKTRAEYLTGCNRYGIESQKLDKDGRPQDWIFFDENQLKLIKTKKVNLESEEINLKVKSRAKKDKGGPLRKDQYPYK